MWYKRFSEPIRKTVTDTSEELMKSLNIQETPLNQWVSQYIILNQSIHLASDQELISFWFIWLTSRKYDCEKHNST